jgi:acetyl/propionyl-CoA carboxylase alpha subunit
VPFLIRLLEHPDIRAGRMHTRFIEEHASELLTTADPPLEALAAAALASPAQPASHSGSTAMGADPWGTIGGWGRQR